MATIAIAHELLNLLVKKPSIDYFMDMNKNELLNLVIKSVKEDLAASVHAAQKTYEDATHEDAKAENKYDTRGLEASYLAGAQAKRAVELKEALNQLLLFKLPAIGSMKKIVLGHAVKLESESKKLTVFLLPKGGGNKIDFEGNTIQVTTPESPLGAALIGKEVGDEVKVTTSVFEITEII